MKKETELYLPFVKTKELYILANCDRQTFAGCQETIESLGAAPKGGFTPTFHRSH